MNSLVAGRCSRHTIGIEINTDDVRIGLGTSDSVEVTTQTKFLILGDTAQEIEVERHGCRNLGHRTVDLEQHHIALLGADSLVG